MTPLILTRDFHGVEVFHAHAISPLSGKGRIVQTAIWTPGESTAEVIGTMDQPDVPREENAAYWAGFQEALRQRGIDVVIGKMPYHLFEHYRTHYGMEDTGDRVHDQQVGELVIAAKSLGRWP